MHKIWKVMEDVVSPPFGFVNDSMKQEIN